MKVLTREQFLDLLDDEDVQELRERWSLPAAMPPDKRAPDFLERVHATSQTTLVQELLTLCTPTLLMLHDVLEVLVERAASLRTTGGLLVLNEELDLSPQAVNAALQWSPKHLKRHASTTWSELRRRFEEEIAPLLEMIAEKARVHVRSRQEDLMRSYMRSLGGRPMEIRKIVTAEFDEEWFRIYEEFVDKLRNLAQKLQAALPHSGELASVVEEAAEGHARNLQHYRYDRDRNDADSRSVSPFDLSPEEKELWKRFEEDVLFLSDTKETEALADVLRIDLFRHRPQLFELWVVAVIIRFFRRSGWSVELLGIALNDAGRVVWNINYAKSSKPVAVFTRRRDGVQAFLFYQLFRRGAARDDMPDIALLPSEDPAARPLLVADPKHSERRGYSLADYERVARRYESVFQADRTCVLEFYPRGNVRYSEKAELIADVAPGQPGVRLFVDRLREVVGSEPSVVAVIDVSGSFISRLPTVVEDLRRLLASGVPLADEVIWFSDVARVTDGLLDAIDSGSLQPPADVAGGGTSVVSALALLEERGLPAAVRLYSDGDFGAITLEQVKARLAPATVDVINPA